MPILNQIGILSKSISDLTTLRNDLVDKAISMGVCWEELVYVDKFSAIKHCKYELNVTLKEAYDIVNKYIEDRK